MTNDQHVLINLNSNEFFKKLINLNFLCDVTMTSYSLYSCFAINLADVSRFSNFVLKSKALTKSFPKMYHLSISIN